MVGFATTWVASPARITSPSLLARHRCGLAGAPALATRSRLPKDTNDPGERGADRGAAGADPADGPRCLVAAGRHPGRGCSCRWLLLGPGPVGCERLWDDRCRRALHKSQAASAAAGPGRVLGAGASGAVDAVQGARARRHRPDR